MPANEVPLNGRRLTSWKEIAAYLDCEVRTAIRWEKERGLPVHRRPGKRLAVYASAGEIDAWLRNGHHAAVSSRGVPRKRRAWLIGVATLAPLASALMVPRPSQPRLGNPVAITNDGLAKRL